MTNFLEFFAEVAIEGFRRVSQKVKDIRMEAFASEKKIAFYCLTRFRPLPAYLVLYITTSDIARTFNNCLIRRFSLGNSVPEELTPSIPSVSRTRV